MESNRRQRRRKRTTWRNFLRANWSCLAAADFFTVEVWTCRGLVTHYVLFVLDLSTRCVHIAGITRNPDEAWMLQIARNLTDPIDGFLCEKRFLIIDRDSKYTYGFRQMLDRSGVTPVRLPPRSPNLNAYAERFIRSVKTECTDRLIFFGERSLQHVIDEYIKHYNVDRPHQGIGNRTVNPARIESTPAQSVECTARLGGLLRSYHRKAA